MVDAGSQLSFHIHSIGWIPRTLRRYRREVVRLIAEVSLGTGALAVIGGTVVIVGFLTAAAGYEVGQQGSSSLGRVGVEAMSGFISAFFNTREAIPVIAGVALTATVGAGFTAQLGAMRVSEEIDALEVMSVPSIPYLVTTRILAGLVAVAPLYAIALFMGYASTEIVSVVLSDQSSGTYTHYFNLFLDPYDVLWSLVKVLVISVVVMCVHCYHGYNASGGPAGVGVAVGRAVRTSLIAIMVIDLVVGIAVYGGVHSTVRVSG
ncbi:MULTISPECIES: MlaE family ABC transporter permease [Rhodococcus]|uniref:MlaE family ABC transporter permease n=1 Tax=Rhodococcus TaxID=1827 RepID=UPI000717E0DC|nr:MULTISPECIES: ABC transporter permease [Rhodococcus]MCZ4618692.1 ABC transporter permease [Rhodococcus qingshengii]MEA1798474.1 ABC transporter permease [Rhodococcus qingshengii]ORI28801.1 ABC transporter permease [Rhodococcus erythropolis]